MTCGCGGQQLGRLGATAPLTTTVTKFPCGDTWSAAQANPTAANMTAYNLCLAQQKATRYISNAGHWVYQEIKQMWNALVQATRNLGIAAAHGLQAVGMAAINTLDWLLKKSQALLNWLIRKFEGAMLIFAAVLGAAFLFSAELKHWENSGRR